MSLKGSPSIHFLALLLPALMLANIDYGQANNTAVQKSAAQTGASTGTGGNSTPQPTVIVSSVKEPVISVNLDLNTFSDYLPFDVDFKIVGGNSTDKIKMSDIISIDCYYAEKRGDSAFRYDTSHHTKWTLLKWVNHQTSNLYWFNIKALKPNKHYYFIFNYNRILIDTEKTKLKAFIRPFIVPIITNKAKNHDFEFNDKKIDSVVQAIMYKLEDALKHDGLTAKLPDTNSVQFQHFFASAHKIIEIYKTTDDDLKDFNAAIASIKKQDVCLTNFRDKYKNITSKSTNKEKIIHTLGSVHHAIFNLLSHPLDQQATDAILAKAYMDTVAAVIDSLMKVSLPLDSEFQSLKTKISEIVGSIGYHFRKYGNDLKALQSIINDQLGSFIDAVSSFLYNDISIAGNSVNGDFVTRANTYVCADLGIALLPAIAKLTPYIGTNIYFRPINTNAPLKWCDHDKYPDGNSYNPRRYWSNWLGRRLSLVIGVSVVSVAKTYIRGDLMANSFNIITGVGFRITDWVRISGGALWYSKFDANPLNTTQTIKPTPFISISFDLRIKTALNNLFSPSVISSVSP